MKRIALLALCAALAACGPAREQSVNEMYDETNRAIVERAGAYDARAENDLRAKEQGLENEGNALLSRIEANAAVASANANGAAGNEAAGNAQ